MQARRNWSEGNPMALLASAGVPLPNVDSELALLLRRCIQIGLRCVQTAPNDRPDDMSAVVRMLRDPNEQIPPPTMPVPIAMPIEEEGDVASLPERWEEDVASLPEARVSTATLYETLEQVNNPIPYNESEFREMY